MKIHYHMLSVGWLQISLFCAPSYMCRVTWNSTAAQSNYMKNVHDRSQSKHENAL
jgi:hypothetical protein